MSIIMENPVTGAKYAIRAPVRGISPIRRFYYMRFWFVGFLSLKSHRLLGVFGLLILIALFLAVGFDRSDIAGYLALLYVALGLYLGPKLPKYYAQHYLAKG